MKKDIVSKIMDKLKDNEVEKWISYKRVRDLLGIDNDNTILHRREWVSAYLICKDIEELVKDEGDN